jgi:ferredoxin
MSRLEIDEERCTGHGRCYSLAPHLFEADEFGHAVLVPTDHIDETDAWTAVQNCPEGAISLDGKR